MKRLAQLVRRSRRSGGSLSTGRRATAHAGGLTNTCQRLDPNASRASAVTGGPGRRVIVYAATLLAASSACRDIDRFDTRDGETYCGSLFGYGDISTGFERQWVGDANRFTLSAKLSTSEMFKAGGVPAILQSNDADFGPCGPDRPLFDRAEVRVLDKALGDRLGAMQLAEDHIADLVTYVDSTCSGSMVSVLSLIQTGSLEVRLLRPAPTSGSDTATTADAIPRFGLFVLKKAKSGCGF